MGYSSKDYTTELFTTGQINILSKENIIIDIDFYTKDNDTIKINKLDLSEFMPTIPNAIKED